jgi:hypothetical protein
MASGKSGPRRERRICAGPALFVGDWTLAQLWLFWLAPLIGAALAGVAYRWIAIPDAPTSSRQKVTQATAAE